jgi:predicted DNA-binding transcriptional regulator AlpA
MKYLSAKQAAELLNIAPATLANMRSARRGPPYRKLGSRVLYEESAIHAWLDSQPGLRLADAVAGSRAAA